MFHSLFGMGTRDAAIAQIFDKPRIMRREAAEFGPRHSGIAQKAFDPAYQHDFLHGRFGVGIFL
jgi:hypothetical protein